MNQFQLMNRFKITRYFLATLDDPMSWRDWHATGTTQDIGVLGLGQRTYPSRFVAALKGEGCGKVPEGVISFDGAQYTLLNLGTYPWGLNAMGGPLVPFRSIAVDRHVIPMRTKVKVPLLVGKTMPDGMVHDGFVWATDTGGRIVGNHIDWFVGTREWCDALSSFPDEDTLIFPA